MPDLIAPHGGVEQPLNLTVPADEIAGFKAEAAKLTKVPVSDADLSTVYRWGDGVLSPTTGPMDSATFNRVLDESVIEHNGKFYAWTIPLSLPVTKELAGQLKKGQKVALTSSAGEIVATLDITDIFEWDKPRYIKSVYLTDRTDHPGADMVLKGDAEKTHLLGGKIRVLPQPKNPKFGKYVLRRAKFANCWPPKAGTASWRFKPATHCIGLTNMRSFMDWSNCSSKATTRARF